MIKGSILQKDITILNVYAQRLKICKANNNRIVRRHRQIHHYSWRIQYPLIRSSRQKIFKDMAERKNTNQLDIIDLYRLLYPTTVKYTFFPSSQGMFTKTDHILGHKTHHSTYERIETIQSTFLHHNGINNRKIARKIPKYLEIKQDILNSTLIDP